MPVEVRNLESGPTVFSDPPRDIAIEWQGAGDPLGGDVQYVPDELIDNVNFIKAINRGILSIENVPAAIQEKMDQQIDAYRAKTDARRQVVDHDPPQPERALTQAQIGEDGKITHVPVTQAERRPRRPARHGRGARDSVPSVNEEIRAGGGRDDLTDIPVIMDAPQREE